MILKAEDAACFNCVKAVYVNGRKHRLVITIDLPHRYEEVYRDPRTGLLARNRDFSTARRWRSASSLHVEWKHAVPCELCSPYREGL